jgi:EF hand domain-containing protein
MQMKKIAALVTLFGLFTVPYVHAEGDAAAKPAHKWKADTNQDGKISLDEYRAANEKRTESQFKRMDTNGDGFVDEAEKKAVGDKMRAMREKRHDAHAKPEAPASN